jgi:pimeloyl-ACP methyl ester carboxylesterase
MLPLVLLHGYPFDHTMWNGVIQALKWKERLITLDLPGFGKSPVLPGEPSLERMADGVAKVLEEIERVVLAGFSMGGYVSLAVAQKVPSRIAGLALINSQPFGDSDEVRAGRRAMIEKVRKEGAGAAAEAALGKMFSQARSNDPDLARFPREGAEKAGAAGIIYALEAMARRPDRTEFLEGFDVPKLLIHSPEDRFIPVGRIRALGMRLSNIQYVEIPEAGHATPLEEPEAVAKALGDWAMRVR